MSETKSETAGWREATPAGETREMALRRLKIRCWRRGTKEMDLILGGFLEAEGARLSDEAFAAFEALTREDDSLLYRWVSGAAQPPAGHAAIIAQIRAQRGLQ